MNVRKLAGEYTGLPSAERKKFLSEVRSDEDLDTLMELAQGPDGRAATRILADLGPRLKPYLTAHAGSVPALLGSKDPKIRMHAAQIIGNTAPDQFLQDLISALEAEDTMFVRPSFLLAVGAAKTEEAKKYLQGYQIRSDIEKHAVEERNALNKALSNFTDRRKAQVRILPSDIVMVSTPNPEITKRALQRGGFRPKIFGRHVAVSRLTRFQDIYRVRAYNTAYMYLGSCAAGDLPSFLASRENAVRQRTQVETYRLEIRGVPHEERVALIEKCAAAITGLINSPSSYSIEIMVEIEDGKAQVFLNPLTDTRFSYRVKTVPASIGCGTAACLMAYASEFFSPDARVLDDFCGAGTLLFERGYYSHHSLTGVDLHLRAIEAANDNSRHARVHPQFHHMDALKFTLKRYNEILVNLPFGMRVGSHQDNVRLYRKYFDVLPQIVTKEGLVVLFTHEKKLTEELLDASPGFALLKRTTFDAGGLYPAAYCLRYRPDAGR